MSSTAASLLLPLQSLRHSLATSLNLSTADIYYHAIEAFFLLLVIYLALTRAYKPWNRGTSANKLTDAQIAAKLASWTPAPLAAPLPQSVRDSLPLDLNLDILPSGRLHVNGNDSVLDFATCNFLGLRRDRAIEERCLNTMRTYGLGACGPRGFYGTTDVHLECEDALADFSGTESAILYSFGAATGNSTIPAFCKRGDLIVADDACNFTLQVGLNLCRAEVRRFTHNDMHDLERILKDVTAADDANPARRKTQRRIILVEGIYQNVGDLCPLDRVIELKEKYLFRVMVDESFSLGVLGKSGKGALQHFAIKRSDVDIATADLGNALAAVGGYCVGNEDVVSHQRLSGAGYCFSASQPPFLATAATVGLQILAERGESLTTRLRTNMATFRAALRVDVLREAGWYIDGHHLSPVMHVRSFDDSLPLATFTKIQEKCLEQGVLISRPVYSQTEHVVPKPSVRITVSAIHSRQDLEKAGQVIREVLCSKEV